jgi:hypothetical protein
MVLSNEKTVVYIKIKRRKGGSPALDVKNGGSTFIDESEQVKTGRTFPSASR